MMASQILAAVILVAVALGFSLLWHRAEAEHRAQAARTKVAIEALAAAFLGHARKMGQSSALPPPVPPPPLPELELVDPPPPVPELADREEDERTHVYRREEARWTPHKGPS
jgi:type IV secretory pathway VirB10-like protein